jgi:hypothetical protein
VKNYDEIERSYVKCGPFSKQQKSLKLSPLEKLESALAALFKQVCEINASVDDTHLKEKALYVAAHLGIANFLPSSRWLDRFKRRHNIVYRTGESTSVDLYAIEDWKNYRLLQEIESYNLRYI